MAIVYQHRRNDTNEVFYVGIGKHTSRAYSTARNYIWEQIVANTEYEVEILHSKITRKQAFTIEEELVNKYGRIVNNTGSLANILPGGDISWMNYDRQERQSLLENIPRRPKKKRVVIKQKVVPPKKKLTRKPKKKKEPLTDRQEHQRQLQLAMNRARKNLKLIPKN